MEDYHLHSEINFYKHNLRQHTLRGISINISQLIFLVRIEEVYLLIFLLLSYLPLNFVLKKHHPIYSYQSDYTKHHVWTQVGLYENVCLSYRQIDNLTV